jgi:hypothetical protein
MAQLLRPLLELVKVGPDCLLEIRGIARSPLAPSMGQDLLVEVLLWVALGTIRG